MLIAALAYPELKACIGIELMQSLAELAGNVAAKFNQLCKDR